MKTVLVYTSVTECEAPPLGIPYLSSYLRRNNHEVAAVNFIEIPSNKKYEQLNDALGVMKFTKNLKVIFPAHYHRTIDTEKILRQVNRLCEEWAKKILKMNGDLIGFSTYDKSSVLNLMTAKKIKENDKDKIIVFGGPDCARWLYANFYIKTEWVDIVIPGEGEIVFNKLVSKVLKYKKIKVCKGCLIKNEGYVYDGGDYPLIDNLDRLPFPDFSDFKLSKYRIPNTLPMVTTRGCPFNCLFCSERLHGYKYRERSVKNVIQEFKFHEEKYNVSRFMLWDSSINANPKRLSELCDQIIKERLDIKWGADARATANLSSNLLKKMYQAGCRYLHFGIESGSQRVLNLMNKGTKVKDIENVLKSAKNAGIHTLAYFILGYPGETENDANKTLEFIKNNIENIDTFFNSRCTIMSRTILEERIKNLNIASVKIEFAKELKRLCECMPMERREINIRDGIGKPVNLTEEKKRIMSMIDTLRKSKSEKENYGIMHNVHKYLFK